MNHATDLPEAGFGARYGGNFTVGDHSARHLRRILRAYLMAWQMPELIDAAGLALTELVANVVRHVPGRRCSLLMLRQPEGVRVEVTDACPSPPLSTAVDELAEGGRGLLIIEAMTDRWGWQPLTDGSPGKTVWFECDAKART
ncbi:ATP-binding protein [Streptomyces flaveus]|uniref:ATP-binding protein n=1 Tax=Streptomyces flaveus TaxID=66370 RepID=UPI003571628E